MLSDRPRVLIVEDSPSVRRLVEVSLRPMGLEIHIAVDGLDAMAKIVDVSPAVVVLDIGLPGIDGWEVLARLRSDPATAATKVLVLTAHAEPEVEERAEEATADDFMTKPFQPGLLREAVTRLLEE